MPKTPTKSATSVVTVRARPRPMLRSAILTFDFHVRGMKTTIATSAATASAMMPSDGMK